MLLTVDVGNTNTVLGVFREQELLAHWRLTTATETFTGTTAGLEASGLLRVARDDGRVEPVIAGDVSEAV